MLRTQFAGPVVDGVLSLSEYSQHIMQTSFDSLIKETNTEVTISEYNLDQLDHYLFELANYIDLHTWPNSKYKDCAEVELTGTRGQKLSLPVVKQLYRPHRLLGKSNTHSGWECPYNEDK